MFFNKEEFIQFLNEKEITWLGVDFSRASFTLPDFNLPSEVMQHYFNDWNMMIISDQKKFNIRISFRKSILHYDLSWITKNNKFPKNHKFAKKVISIDSVIGIEQIAEMVKAIEIDVETRYALYFIVNSFDSKRKAASIWVALFNTETAELVLCENFTEKPNGFGIRTHWARVFYDLIYHIHKETFQKWLDYAEEDEVVE